MYSDFKDIFLLKYVFKYVMIKLKGVTYEKRIKYKRKCKNCDK